MEKTIDKSNIRIGENGHNEYMWANNHNHRESHNRRESHNHRETILQLSFQLTRQTSYDKVIQVFRDLIINIQSDYKNKEFSPAVYQELIVTLYKLIGQTRDIIDGKGEYQLSYRLLIEWYNFYPESSKFLVNCFVNNEYEHPYGSWKDIRCIADMCDDIDRRHPLISYCVHLINEQLRKDLEGTQISLVSKWIPREKSKYRWLYERLAEDYFKEYMVVPSASACNKCYTHYRKLISGLNKQLDTVQIKQCAKEWSTIDPSVQTSITMQRQIKAFLNVGIVRYEYDNDRIQCAHNFKEYIAQNDSHINGKRVGINELVKNALKVCDALKVCEALKVCDALDAKPNSYHLQTQIDLLNAQWLDNSTQTKPLQKMIPIVDVSSSMNGEPLYAAIGLGIRVAEKSLVGKRILIFSETPTWINLEDTPNFVDMVKKISTANSDLNSNFYDAMKLILDAIIEQKMRPEDVTDMTIAIFSDMQMDLTKNKNGVLYRNIEQMYNDAGIKIHGTPYKPPHILFWNLRSTDGFPNVYTQNNTSMMSGFSPSSLNLFCDGGTNALRNPWNMLIKSLASDRYNILQEYMICHL
jgi:hypothetical protein